MKYEDFRITITTKAKQGHRVHIDSPAGDFTGYFINSIDKSGFDKMLRDNGLRVKSLKDARSRKGLRGIKQVKSTEKLEDIGKELFKALFQGEILNAYNKSQGMVYERKRGLRIRIRIDPGIEEYAELINLPWEFLYDETENLPFELLKKRTVIRDSFTPEPLTSLEVESPLRVLAVVSDPKNYPPLKLGREIKFLKKISDQTPYIKVKFLRKTTIEELLNEMGKSKYHVFHFMGHGGYDGRKKRCVLIFKGDKNLGFTVDGKQLSTSLSDSFRLVFLNACETARIPEENPFEAIPTEFLQGGIPAVLSMQFPITDTAAIKFCEYFYRCLTKGLPVDQCVGKGRQQISFKQGISTEWGTPVLFMRSKNGVIFKLKQNNKKSQSS
ncbi:MAG: CHAT domain-containing protein [Candidatus Aminicenantes bacterium]|nr:CHAT domain-containing protein [Candidatus Aminicenantes bacterium]